MTLKGFVLVAATGSYEDYHEELIGFSESKEELENKITELKISNLKLKKYEDTRGIRFEYFRNYNWAFDNNEPFNKWIKENPIPEEILEFVELDDRGIYEIHLEVPSLRIKEITKNYKWE